MTNSEIYNTIAESLQCDIDTNAISYEYASIINDIAYDKFITESELPKNVESVLDRYISEAAADDEVTESTNDELGSMLEMVDTISATCESGDITNAEYSALIESVFDKIDAYTEAFAGAGGARGKYAEVQAKILISTLRPIIKSVKDYYKREIFGNHLTNEKDIKAIKAPTVNDLVTKGKLPAAVLEQNKNAMRELKRFSAARNLYYIDEASVEQILKNVSDDMSGCGDAEKIFKYCDEALKELVEGGKDFLDDIKNAEADVEDNTWSKKQFKKKTGQYENPFSEENQKRKEHDAKLEALKKRNAEKIANRK